MSHEIEPTSSVWTSLQDIVFRGVQLIDLRLALVIGLVAFLVAVGFDSAGNQAEAADLTLGSHATSNPAITVVEGARPRAAASPNLRAGPRDEQLATAQRLHHGTMTSAVMTSSRLTQAHFFTDLPSGQ